jgi:hypothetical protein
MPSATCATQPMIGTKIATLRRIRRYTATTKSAIKIEAPPHIPNLMARSIQAGSPHFTEPHASVTMTSRPSSTRVAPNKAP